MDVISRSIIKIEMMVIGEDTMHIEDSLSPPTNYSHEDDPSVEVWHTSRCTLEILTRFGIRV